MVKLRFPKSASLQPVTLGFIVIIYFSPLSSSLWFAFCCILCCTLYFLSCLPSWWNKRMYNRSFSVESGRAVTSVNFVAPFVVERSLARRIGVALISVIRYVHGRYRFTRSKRRVYGIPRAGSVAEPGGRVHRWTSGWGDIGIPADQLLVSTAVALGVGGSATFRW